LFVPLHADSNEKFDEDEEEKFAPRLYNS